MRSVYTEITILLPLFFYLISLFFWRPLWIRPGPPKFPGFFPKFTQQNQRLKWLPDHCWYLFARMSYRCVANLSLLNFKHISSEILCLVVLLMFSFDALIIAFKNQGWLRIGQPRTVCCTQDRVHLTVVFTPLYAGRSPRGISLGSRRPRGSFF